METDGIVGGPTARGEGGSSAARNRAGPFGRVLRSREGTKEQGTLPARCSMQSKAGDAPYSAFPSAAAGEAGGVGLCSGVQVVAAWPRQQRVTWRRCAVLCGCRCSVLLHAQGRGERVRACHGEVGRGNRAWECGSHGAGMCGDGKTAVAARPRLVRRHVVRVRREC